VDISSGVGIKKSVYSDNKEVVIKRNQYSEVQEYTEKKYRMTGTKKRKTEKCNTTTDYTAI
jgi:phage pi2 protein 07